jgi:hypothetical protein
MECCWLPYWADILLETIWATSELSRISGDDGGRCLRTIPKTSVPFA